MGRALNSILARMLALAGITTTLTMAIGLVAYYGAAYFHLQIMMRHMPPLARAELESLIAHGQKASPRYFELFEHYGSGALAVGDAGFMLGIACFSVLAGGSVAVLLARRISGPIIAVAEAAAAMASGDRSVRVQRKGGSSEVGVLIEGFNRMAGDIEAYERERTVFTAGVTHELRTPLTILKGRLHGISDGMVPATAAEAERLLRQVEHLGRIVEDLKTLAHADAGELALDLRVLAIDDVLRVCVSDLRGSASAARIRFEEVYAGGKIHGDTVRVSQTVLNLLTNAIKHAPPDSAVQVRSRVANGHTEVEVIDSGSGFEAGDAENLFMPFWRSRAARREGTPGSGLGLTLAAKLADAHGGHIVAANREDGPGAIFRIHLPLAPTAAPATESPRGKR